MTVRKHMSAHPITISDDTDFKKALGLMQKHRIRRLPVVDAAMLMIERKIGGLPVVDESRRLLGIITETDLLKALAAILQRDPSRPRSRKARSAGASAQAAVPKKRSRNPRPAGKAKPAGAKSKGGRKPRPATPRKVKRAGSR